jgi:hypothetical protein
MCHSRAERAGSFVRALFFPGNDFVGTPARVCCRWLFSLVRARADGNFLLVRALLLSFIAARCQAKGPAPVLLAYLTVHHRVTESVRTSVPQLVQHMDLNIPFKNMTTAVVASISTFLY